MIEVSRLSKRYDDGTVAIGSLSLRLGRRITSVLGRNGAGKTTLIKILSTQLAPTSGKAIVNGVDVVKDSDRIRGMISSIPQEVRTWDIASPYEHVSMYLSARGMPKRDAEVTMEKAFKELGLWHVKDKHAGTLSGGMKRKIFVAMALASNAQVIFLDEPTTGLDPISRLEVWSAIKKLRSTVVITTHYMEEAKELSDEVALIDKGSLVAQGTVSELLKRFRGRLRVEGPKGRYAVGGIHVSYVKEAQASRLMSKGYSIKPVSLEDLFIINGGGGIES